MQLTFLPRTLWFSTADQKTELAHTELHLREEPLVVLGEAGMGKTDLLKWVAQTHKYAYCTAADLTSRDAPEALTNESGVLVIDALDELAISPPADAVRLVLKCLDRLNNPHFILACRVADWRSAMTTEAINERYKRRPLELHLKPLTDEQVLTFVTEALGAEKTDIVIRHFDGLGLQSWLGNPHTLNMITKVANGRLPRNRTELFEMAVYELAEEFNELRNFNCLAQTDALNASGAACAALILTGSNVISCKVKVKAGELALKELQRLPNGADIQQVLGSRLFSAHSSERFGYWHRSTAEYLGARWLRYLADTPRKRRRLLALFHQHGSVPGNLRGMHAWLAKDSFLAPDVIAMDPVGLIEYGDAQDLEPDAAQALLQALKHLAAQNPGFRDWQSYTAAGIARRGLIDELQDFINQKDQPIGLRHLVLESLKGTEVVPTLQADLLNLVKSPFQPFVLRRAALEPLAGTGSRIDWPAVLHELEQNTDDHSIPIALALMNTVGYALFDAARIARLAFANAGQPSRIGEPNIALDNVGQSLPCEQIAGFLDALTHLSLTQDHAHGSTDEDGCFRNPVSTNLVDLVSQLAMRYVSTTPPDAQGLLHWLGHFSQFGTSWMFRQPLIECLQNNTTLRRAVQRYVLLNERDEPRLRQRFMHMEACSYGFTCTEDDVIALLDILRPGVPGDERWREVIQLVDHDDAGASVRAAAQAFAAHDSGQMEWVERLASQDWKTRHAELKRQGLIEYQEKQANTRQDYLKRIEQVRRGVFHTIKDFAKEYLGRSNQAKTVPAHERIAHWLGADFVEPAHEGFAAYLQRIPEEPSAKDIATPRSIFTSQEAGHIIIAALAERIRTGMNLHGLSNTQLTYGFFAFFHAYCHEDKNFDALKQQLELELDERALWEPLIRSFYEPQLQKNTFDGRLLDDLLFGKKHEALLTGLLIEWLQKFPDLHHNAESQLIELLFREGHQQELKALARCRTALATRKRQLDWDAVGLLVDFKSSAARLSNGRINKALLGHLQGFSNELLYPKNKQHSKEHIAILEWIISNFRSRWPMKHLQKGDPIDEARFSEFPRFLQHLISRLANNSCEDSSAALKRLREARKDSYTGYLLQVTTEQKSRRVEELYAPVRLDEILVIVQDQRPRTQTDLRTWMLEELKQVQDKVRSDDVDSWRGFYSSETPHKENDCRDYLVGLLRQGTQDISFKVEEHVGSDKEVDISCRTEKAWLPIEVKGQWHPDLWIAADKQLDLLYASDWRGEKQGIYLVLWFGKQALRSKDLTSLGRGKKRPASPDQLAQMLVAKSKGAQEKRIEIVVLDLTPPPAANPDATRKRLAMPRPTISHNR